MRLLERFRQAMPGLPAMPRLYRRLALGLGLPLAALLVLGAGRYYQAQRLCTGLHVQLHPATTCPLLAPPSLEAVLQGQGQLAGTPVGQLNLGAMAQRLYATGWVAKAALDVDAQQRVRVLVTLRQPSYRLAPDHGPGLYLDANLRPMPLGPDEVCDVPVLTGAFTQDPGCDTLHDTLLMAAKPLLLALAQDTLLHPWLGQLTLDHHGEITLYPSLGPALVRLGQPLAVEDKLARLRHFATTVLPQTGWGFYHTLDLRFHDQVVAEPVAALP